MSVRNKLLKDHADIERDLQELEHVCEGADAPALQRVWTRFERHLKDHLQGEEEFLFPALEKDHSLLVDEAREEHAAIRRALDELGIAVDLHTVRKTTIDNLLGKLRAHSAWEDGELYPLADAALGADPRARLLELIGRVGKAA